MTPNGKHDPVIDLLKAAGAEHLDDPTEEDYEALLELDRLEELVEHLDELGADTRDDIAALSPTELTVAVQAEMAELGVTSREDISRRMSELEALLGDE